MSQSPLEARLGHQIRAALPSVMGWDSHRGALGNVLLFGLVAAGGEWIVHQIEYLIVYGARYGAVMAASPHRYYMAPMGLVLAVIGQALLLLVVAGLALTGLERRRLLALLPEGARRLAPAWSWGVPMVAVVRTAVALASLQIVLYLLQENVESALVGAGWPGLSTILAPEHVTVVPLHLVAAVCGSLILRAVSAWLHRSREALEIVRDLVDRVLYAGAPPHVLMPRNLRLPARQLLVGVIGLRSPPFFA